MGWIQVPGGIITEYGPNLNIASKGIYRHIILTAKKSNTNQYVFNEPPIRDSLTLTPQGYWIPDWGTWTAIPAPPRASGRSRKACHSLRRRSPSTRPGSESGRPGQLPEAVPVCHYLYTVKRAVPERPCVLRERDNELDK